MWQNSAASPAQANSAEHVWLVLGHTCYALVSFFLSRDPNAVMLYITARACNAFLLPRRVGNSFISSLHETACAPLLFLFERRAVSEAQNSANFVGCLTWVPAPRSHGPGQRQGREAAWALRGGARQGPCLFNVGWATRRPWLICFVCVAIVPAQTGCMADEPEQKSMISSCCYFSVPKNGAPFARDAVRLLTYE